MSTEQEQAQAKPTPTGPGWYWFKWEGWPGHSWQIVEVRAEPGLAMMPPIQLFVHVDGAQLPVKCIRADWRGPLPRPDSKTFKAGRELGMEAATPAAPSPAATAAPTPQVARVSDEAESGQLSGELKANHCHKCRQPLGILHHWHHCQTGAP